MNRKSMTSNASYGYAGHIDPRSVERKDYRWFVRPDTKGSAKRFQKLQLNMFVDCSGSFTLGIPVVSSLIRSLVRVEAQTPDFCVDVVTMEEGNKLLPRDQRFIPKSGLGNRMDDDFADIFKHLQKSDARTVNVLVWDGRLDYSHEIDHIRDLFKVLNRENVIVISDPTNKRFLDHCKRAKLIWVNGAYATHLKENVIAALEALI